MSGAGPASKPCPSSFHQHEANKRRHASPSEPTDRSKPVGLARALSDLSQTDSNDSRVREMSNTEKEVQPGIPRLQAMHQCKPALLIRRAASHA